MISITFVSNFFNHHERFFCDELYNNPNVDFHFIQTEIMDDERLNMGWGIDITSIPYCTCSYGNKRQIDEALRLCNESDVLILGSARYEFIAERVRKNKLTFFYAERLFRQGLWHLLYPPTFFTVIKRFVVPGRKSNFYLLCASGYTALDTSNILAFDQRRFKWGHFIDVKSCADLDELLAERNDRLDKLAFVSILWAGRLIKLKHPEYPIKVARTLKQMQIPFIINIIGTGEMEHKLLNMILEYDLSDNVRMLGAMSPAEVRQYMENSDIFLFTSDFNEGWGAVLGESMASGCAVVTSHGIGATPFLVNHKMNGLVYETGNYNSFERNVLKLVASKELRTSLSRNALKTMLELWNPKVAADRFYELCNSLIEFNIPIYYETGPISKAAILKNNWFKDDTI